VELAMVVPFLFLILVAAVDFGKMYFLAIEVAGAAEAGANYGALHYSDTAGMKAAAVADGQQLTGLTTTSTNPPGSVTASYGCECSDGTGYSASCGTAPTSCSANVVYQVKVTVNYTYSSLIPWTGVPGTIPMSYTATMRNPSGSL
jgi:Flp pilus assembly protein TadG